MTVCTKWLSKHSEWGHLVLRVVLGLVFMIHGWSKFNNMAGTVNFFGTLGLPAFVAYLVMALELGGGALILLGLFTRQVSILGTITMLFAIILAKLPSGGNYEFDLSLLGMSLALVFLGPGMLSLEKALFKKEL